jgi:hypothetical protein
MKERILRLADEDRTRRIFGASGHGYELSLVTHVDLEALEARCRIRLPPEYRDFLTRVGAGAGPYYGLLGAREVSSEMDNRWGEFEVEYGRRPCPSRPFPLSRFELQRSVHPEASATGPIAAEYPLDGCIPIASHGCTFWSLLVTAGELAGAVVDAANYVGFDGQWLPACVPPAIAGEFSAAKPEMPRPPNFLEWYAAWLNHSTGALRHSVT